MRAEGKSFNEIARDLQVSKSTISFWCREISLTKKQREVLLNRRRSAATRGLFFATEKKRGERILRDQANAKQGSLDVGALSKRDIFTVGLALYWGEGYRKGNREFGFTNSDAGIIQTFMVWLERCYTIPRSDLILRVSVNTIHQKRERAILAYWSWITNVPLSQFSKTSFIKTKSRKRYLNLHKHFGTLRIKVRRGTALRQRVLGSLKKIEESVLSAWKQENQMTKNS